jgi:hypothetical protein
MDGDNEDDDRLGTGVLVGFRSRGGNDSETEGTGNKIGSGVTVGSERAGGVLELE